MPQVGADESQGGIIGMGNGGKPGIGGIIPAPSKLEKDEQPDRDRESS